MKANNSILIVDDAYDMCEILENILLDQKFSVISAHNGNDALSIIASRHFDAALIDVQIKDTNGLTIAEAVHKKNADTLIYIMTGYSLKKHYTNAKKYGIRKIFEKPFNIKSVINIIKKELKQKNKY